MSITIHPDGSASCKCGWSCTEFKQTHNCVDYLQGRITELEESNMQAQWREDILKEKVADLQAEVERLKEDLQALADAVLNAKVTLEHDLYRTRVKNAHSYLEEANDVALNWMSEP